MSRIYPLHVYKPDQFSFHPVAAGEVCHAADIGSDDGYWQRVHGRRPYDLPQPQAAPIVINTLQGRNPGHGVELQLADVATPGWR